MSHPEISFDEPICHDCSRGGYDCPHTIIKRKLFRRMQDELEIPL